MNEEHDRYQDKHEEQDKIDIEETKKIIGVSGKRSTDFVPENGRISNIIDFIIQNEFYKHPYKPEDVERHIDSFIEVVQKVDNCGIAQTTEDIQVILEILHMAIDKLVTVYDAKILQLNNSRDEEKDRHKKDVEKIKYRVNLAITFTEEILKKLSELDVIFKNNIRS